MSFTMKDLQQLDQYTYDKIEKEIINYEELRGIVEYRLKKIGSLEEAKTYALYDAVLGELKQTGDIKQRRSILEQVRSEYLKGGF